MPRGTIRRTPRRMRAAGPRGPAGARGRARRSRLAHQRADATELRAPARRRDDRLPGALRHDGSRVHHAVAVADGDLGQRRGLEPLGHGRRLARERRLVGLESGDGDEAAVGGNVVPRSEQRHHRIPGPLGAARTAPVATDQRHRHADLVERGEDALHATDNDGGVDRDDGEDGAVDEAAGSNGHDGSAGDNSMGRSPPFPDDLHRTCRGHGQAARQRRRRRALPRPRSPMAGSRSGGTTAAGVSVCQAGPSSDSGSCAGAARRGRYPAASRPPVAAARSA
jgi:hypothetical protein